MITYNTHEIKKAILKTIPVGTRIDVDNIENFKWMTILNDGFEKRGWLEERNFRQALGELRRENRFERHRSRATGQRFYVRVA